MSHPRRSAGATLDRVARRTPPHAFFAVSAVFHYLGPAFAVLLFPAIGVLGVAWLRIASAAAVFALWTRPLATLRAAAPAERRLLFSLGACLALMNASFYLALDRLPLGLVATIEFVGSIALAAYGVRTRRNLIALLFAGAGALLLIDLAWSDDPVGLFWAVVNGALFVAYIALGHRAARDGSRDGVRRLGAAMAIAFLIASPIGLVGALAAIGDLRLLAAGIGVGICSSVIPYLCDQHAMARLPRASFALLLALLPATATLVGAVVLAQIPSARDALGVGLVMLGVAIHQPATATPPASTPQT